MIEYNDRIQFVFNDFTSKITGQNNIWYLYDLPAVIKSLVTIMDEMKDEHRQQIRNLKSLLETKEIKWSNILWAYRLQIG